MNLLTSNNFLSTGCFIISAKKKKQEAEQLVEEFMSGKERELPPPVLMKEPDIEAPPHLEKEESSPVRIKPTGPLLEDPIIPGEVFRGRGRGRGGWRGRGRGREWGDYDDYRYDDDEARSWGRPRHGKYKYPDDFDDEDFEDDYGRDDYYDRDRYGREYDRGRDYDSRYGPDYGPDYGREYDPRAPEHGPYGPPPGWRDGRMPPPGISILIHSH